MKSKGDIDRLIEALGDKHFSRRRAATKALTEIGAPAVDPLLHVLTNREYVEIGKPLDMFINGVKALGQIGDLRALPILIDTLRARPREMEKAAVEALSQIGAPAVDLLIGVLGDLETMQKAVEMLENIGVRSAKWLRVGGFMPLAQHSAVEALVNIGTPAVESLVAALRHRNPKVRQLAAMALGRIGDPRAVEPLVTVLRDFSPSARREAVVALRWIGDPRAEEALVVALGDQDESVRSEAEFALLWIRKRV